MAEGESVSRHFLKMQAYIEKLEMMKSPMLEDLAEDLIIGSLPGSYKNFVMNHHMRESAMSLNELHNALKTAEADMGKTKENSVLTVASISKKVAKNYDNKSKSKRALSSQLGKSGSVQASTSKGSRKKNSPSSATECFYCHEKGHISK